MEPPILEMKTPWPLVNVEEENGELVVRFHHEAFSWPAIEEVGLTLLCLLDETDGSPFLLDFGNVDYVSGFGLEQLVLVSKKLATSGRRLVLRNVRPNLMKVFCAPYVNGEFVVRSSDAHGLTVAQQGDVNLHTGG
jgi:anti-anti-sigma regulatory factor